MRSFLSVAFLVLLSLGFELSAAAGPIFPTRTVLVHPRWNARPTPEGDTARVLDNLGVYGGIARGIGSDDGRYSWIIQIGTVLEFVRWGESSAFIGISSNELSADTRSTISFNPIGVIWEEGFLYAKRGESLDWQAGAIYRCRHDIDNGDFEIYGNNEHQRTLIYCSAMGKLIGKPFHLFDNVRTSEGRSRVWGRADIYAITQDYRIPYSTQGQGTDYEKLAFSTTLSTELRLLDWGSSGVYARGDVQLSGFGAETGLTRKFSTLKTFTFDSRTEIGYELEGRALRLQFYGGYESWQDDQQIPTPRNTQYALLGFRLSGIEMTH